LHIELTDLHASGYREIQYYLLKNSISNYLALSLFTAPVVKQK